MGPDATAVRGLSDERHEKVAWAVSELRRLGPKENVHLPAVIDAAFRVAAVSKKEEAPLPVH